jgi:hypothetical protein
MFHDGSRQKLCESYDAMILDAAAAGMNAALRSSRKSVTLSIDRIALIAYH